MPKLDPGGGGAENPEIVGDTGTKTKPGPDVRALPPGVDDPKNLPGGPTRPSDVDMPPGFEPPDSSGGGGGGGGGGTGGGDRPRTPAGPGIDPGDAAVQPSAMKTKQPPGEPANLDRVSPATRARIQQQRRTFLEQQAESLSGRVPGDVDPSRLRANVRRIDGELVFVGGATSDLRRDIGTRFDRFYKRTFGTSRPSQSDFGPGGEAAEVGEALEVREDLAERAREELDAPGFELGDELAIEREGDTLSVGLTPQGRRFAIKDRLARQGEIELGTQEAAVPLGGQFGLPETIETETRTREITDLDQLKFDEEGNLVDVAPPPDATLSENIAELESKGVPTAPAVGLAGSLSLVESGASVGGAAASAFSENVGEPLVEVGGDVLGLGQDVALRSLAGKSPLEAFSDPDVQAAAGDVVRGEKAEQQQANFAEVLGEKGSQAVTSIPEIALGLPEAAETGVKTAGEAGAFAVQNPLEESVVATGSETKRVGTEVAVGALDRPFVTTGQLIATGGVFKAARAAGPRISATTRAAIQPGEELLGKGGAATFARASSAAESAGLSRTASALETTGKVGFPRGEPLFASEEAAILVGSKALGAGRRGAGRVRQGLPSVEIETEAPSIENAPTLESFQGELVPRVGFEVDRGSVNVETDAGALGRFDPAGRLRREAISARFGTAEVLADIRRGIRNLRMGEIDIEAEEEEPGFPDVDEPAPIRMPFENPLDVEADTKTEQDDEFQPEPLSERETEGEGGKALMQGETGFTMQRVIVRGETEAEAESETERAVEPELEVEQELEREAEVAMDKGRLKPEVGTRAYQDSLETEVEREQEREDEIERRREIEIEREFEREFEAEQEREQELERELELEQELERELESELELELEAEQELETDYFEDEPTDEGRRDDEFGEFTKAFEFDVTEPGEVGKTIEQGLENIDRTTDEI